ncbi:sugar kinase [Pelomonas sp. KK5]|uniref:sugar kinase n=1 Tax=Pelomonas sp. KK5 TaxID=1855730 RepID=UPI00097C49E8|nr:sugar kinase [Pelomonas sp. KK5]
MNPNNRLVAVGECMIELREVEPGLMRQAFGGDTLNTALYLARLAGSAYSVSYATALGGGDPYSEAMVKAWEAEGIDCGFVARCEGEVPGLYSIQVDPDGERRFSYWRSAAPAKRYLDLANCPLEARLAEVDVLYLSGISLAILTPGGRERLFDLAARLRHRGGRVVFDNNYRARLWASQSVAAESYARIYELASTALITLNDEADVLGGCSEAEALERVRAYGVPEKVIKRGSEPTMVLMDGMEPVVVPTERVPKVVDTTAAGDSFGAGYLAARLHGLDVAAAARAGNRLAGTVIQHPGAVIPTAAMPANLFS